MAKRRKRPTITKRRKQQNFTLRGLLRKKLPNQPKGKPSIKKNVESVNVKLKKRVEDDGTVQWEYLYASANNTKVYIGLIEIPKNNKAIVSCSCPNFRYVYEVANNKVGSSIIINSNGDEPVIRNPMNIPGICKHLRSAMIQISSSDG